MEQAQQAFCAEQEQLNTLIHELKSPISVALSCVQMLKQKATETENCLGSEECVAFVDLAERNIYRSLRAANNIIDMMRLSADEVQVDWQYINLVPLVQEFCDYSEAYAKMHEIKVLFVTEFEVMPVQCDAKMIGRALMNIIGNALKTVRPKEGAITVTLTKENGCAVITVEDNGYGIEIAKQKHIFEKNWQGVAAQSNTGGMGLGLYLAKEFLGLHDGDIFVQSEEGVRTCFTIKLPLKSKKMPSEMPQELRSSAVPYHENWVLQQVEIELSAIEN